MTAATQSTALAISPFFSASSATQDQLFGQLRDIAFQYDLDKDFDAMKRVDAILKGMDLSAKQANMNDISLLRWATTLSCKSIALRMIKLIAWDEKRDIQERRGLIQDGLKGYPHSYLTESAAHEMREATAADRIKPDHRLYTKLQSGPWLVDLRVHSPQPHLRYAA